MALSSFPAAITVPPSFFPLIYIPGCPFHACVRAPSLLFLLPLLFPSTARLIHGSFDRSDQLFQYSGSSADASKGFRAPAVGAATSNDNDAGGDGDGGDSGSGEASPKGKGKGTGKSKSKGKGRASVAATAAATTSADAGSAGAGAGAGAAAARAAIGSLPQDVGEDEGDGEAGAPTGHAMLKSRLTSVSLRGLVQVDDKAVTVRKLGLVRLCHICMLQTMCGFLVFPADMVSLFSPRILFSCFPGGG